MSKTVDERVVSMQFDNKQFEANVQTSMSTLDKLKQKLDFKGASKGLENVNAAVKNVNMSGLSSAVETVSMKFSALQVMAVTALANITNSAINAGKRIVHALTIAPITTGFQEYELKMNSVQTIMASTGESLETVNEYLEELNKYADKTIYSFSDMTSNIGKFTNAGVKLEDAVMAIKGISNEAAVSGANANEASHAMYNFAQALSAGYVKLIDWKSIETANMSTVEFKNQLIQTAVELGTLIEVDGKYKSTTTDLNGNVSKLFTSTSMFNESLSSQWMTTEVLVETLKDYADETTDIGKKAYAAAQDIKTFTQLFDTLKEAAQSGWAQTWELIIGDFDEAKEFLTGLYKTFGGIIDAMSEARNKLLGGALNSKWDQLLDKINAAGISAKAFQDKLKETAKKSGISIDELIEEYGSLSKVITSGKIPVDVITKTIKSLINAETTATESTKELGDIVDRVIKGEFGTTQSRWIALTEAGYDWAEVQNLVNERLGSSVRHLSSLTEEQVKNADSLSDLSDEQLKNKGYTDEQIQALRDLKKAMDEGGTSINDLINDLEKPSGRELLLESLSNIINGAVGACKALSKAWKEIFPPLTSDRIYNLIEGLNKLTSHLRLTDEETGELNANGEKLKRTFKGILAVLDIVRTIVGGALSVAFKILSKVLGAFDLTILDVTASVGDAIVKFRDWLHENSLIAKVFNKTVEVIVKVAKAISKWFKEFSQLPAVQNTIEKFKETFTFDNIEKTIKSITKTIKKWIDTLMQIPLVNDIVNKFKDIFGKMSSVGSDLVEGFKKGLNDNSKTLWDVLVDFAKGILQKVRDVLGIESPSTETHEDGKNCILGFIEGIKEMLLKLWAFLKGVASKTVEVFKKINWSSVFAGGLSIGFLAVINKFANAFEAITSPMEGTGKILNKSARKIKKILNNVAKVVKSFSKLINSIAFEHTAKGIKDLAISLAILVGAIIILTYIETDKLWNAVEVIGALAGILVALSVAVALLSKSALSISKEGLNAENSFSSILSIALSLLMVALVVKMIGSMDPEKAIIGFIGLKTLMFVILEVMVACALLTKGNHGANANQMSKALLSISIVFWILASVVKKIGKIKPEQALMGLLGLKTMAFTIVEVMAACALLTKGNLSANANTISTTLLAVAGAFFILGVVAKMLATMTWDGMGKAAAGLTGLTIIVGGLIGIVRLAGNNAPKIGFTLFGIATAIAILAWISKLIAGMSWEEMGKAAAGITGLSAIVSGLISAVRLAGNNAPKIALSLTAMAVGIAALAVVAVLLSSVSIENLAKGITAVGLLGGIVSGMVVAARGASDCYKNLIVMAVIIALLAAIVYAFYTLDDTDKLYAAVGAISIVFGAFALILETSKNCKDIKISTLLLMLGAVLVLSGILILLSKLEIESCIEIAGSLALLMIALSTALLITSNAKSMDKKQVEAIAAVMLALVGAIALIGLVLAMVNALGIDSSIGTVFALATLLEALSVALVIVSHSKSMDIKQVGAIAAVMFALVGAIALIGLVLAMVNALGIDSSIGTVFALATLLEALSVALVIVSHSKSMDIKQVGAIAAVMFALVGAMALIGLVLAMVNALGIDSSIETVFALATLLEALSVALVIVSHSKSMDIKQVGAIAAVMFALVGAIALIGLVLAMVNALGIDSSIGTVFALATLLEALSVALVIVSHSKSMNFKQVGAIAAVMLALVGAMALIGLVLVMMTVLPVKNAMGNAIVLSTLLIVLTGVATVLSAIGFLGRNILKGAVGLAALTVVMALLGLVLVMMSVLPVKNAMVNTIVLSTLLIVLTGVATVLSVIGFLAPNIVAGAVGLAALTVVMALIGLVLAMMVALEIRNASEIVKMLSGLLMCMANVCVILSSVGPLALIGVTAMAALEALMIATAAFAVAIGSLMTNFPELENFLNTGLPIMVQIAGAIGEMIGAFMEAVAESLATILPVIGKALSDFILYATPFIVGIKMVDESVLAGAGILAAAIIALTVSELIAAIGSFLGIGFVALGIELSAFMFAALPFIAGLKTITPEDAIAASNLAALIEAITVSSVIDGIASFLGIGSIGTLGEKLSSFGGGMKSFSDSIAELSDEDLARVKIAAEAGKLMAEMSESIPKTGGWVQKILGAPDMVTFSESIVAFGEALVAFGISVSTLSEDNYKKISIATDAGTALSDLNNSVPKTGGWAQTVLGAQDMTTFGNGIVAFGECLVAYADTVSELSEADITAVSTSADVGKKLADLNESIPKSGGWAQDILGSQDMTTFGDGLIAFGNGLKGYITSVKDIDGTSIGSIIYSGNAVDEIKEVINKLPKSGGIGKSIFGERDPAAFGDGIRSLGLGISSYIFSVKSISDNDNAKISKSKDVIEDIADAIEAVPTDSKSINNTPLFVAAMSSLATNIVDYIDTMSTIDDAGLAAISTSKDVIADIVDILKSVAKIKSRKVSLAVTQIQNLADSISGMTLTNFSGADKFKTAIDTIVSADFEGLSSGVEELGEVSFSDFVSAFEESASKVDETGEILTSGIAAGIKSGRKNIDDAMDDITVSISSKATKFYLIGTRAMKNFADGILTQTVISKKAVTSVINACRDTANAKYRNFYNVGKYLVQGFASGIKENTFIAEVAASAMAKAAYKAAKEALDIHSPSKIFRKLGFAIPEGLAMGIDKLSYMVGNSVISMTKSAINGTKDAISRIASIVTNDIDAQPTIRPVLDLSDVRSGANAIGNMLNGRTLSIATRNVGTINSMMKYNQNGANSDVISAIEDLGRKLGNTNGNTYNINGITYDDGSGVSDAIETLIRAAKIERRS